MDAYLSWGKTDTGTLEHISEVVSGKSRLSCLFCDCSLVTVRGTQLQHHFRHDGKTCRESAEPLLAIQGWDHFHLNLPADVVDQLLSGYQRHGWMGTPRAYYGEDTEVADSLLSKGLLYLHSGYGHRFSDEAMVVVGGFDLSEFGQWMRDKMVERLRILTARVAAKTVAPRLLAIERRRQKSLLTATLYGFKFTGEDGRVIHKIGRTTRPPEQRLAETLQDIKRYLGCDVHGEVLYVVPNGGHVEQYALYRYRDCRLEMGSHQEYLELPVAKEATLGIDFEMLARSSKPVCRA